MSMSRTWFNLVVCRWCKPAWDQTVCYVSSLGRTAVYYQVSTLSLLVATSCVLKNGNNCRASVHQINHTVSNWLLVAVDLFAAIHFLSVLSIGW